MRGGGGAIRRVAVLGAGTMGHGIAQVASMGGFPVCLFDQTEELITAGVTRIRAGLAKGVERGNVTPEERDRALSAIRSTTDLGEACADADLLIEAIPENYKLKCDLFRRLSEIGRADAILASNTSSLSITRIAAAARNPERVVGLHFFNPPAVMPLVEIVRGRETSDSVVAAAFEFTRRIGKEAITVNDSPGFATSRLGLALGLEAMGMVEQGVASAADIDRAMEKGYGHPMGPLRVSDLVGLDVRLAIAETLHQELREEHFRPPEILREKVRSGKLGRKTGEGFFRWPEK